ncbi:dUTP diphosphatase [Terribacillus saccharophilus]|uniref:dUTP diphosphatase n=1 Tax=Terribacillus saccharophilus TaxID=361277 RepID=UPI003822C446
MNLKALFETQAKLDADILVKHPVQAGEDRLSKKILALQVELGECANEQRSWKFWSKNQEPCRYKEHYDLTTDRFRSYDALLEEYIDCLHFILSIGLDHNFDKDYPGLAIEPITLSSIEEQFTELMRCEWERYYSGEGGYYTEGLELFLGLGRMLGLAQVKILNAYYEKNKINLRRQENGY